jgi:putative hydrolase of the HAD superfamily
MANGWLKSIAGCLENLAPMETIATGVEYKLTPLPDIEVVLFDIYGTLLISSSGDVESSEFAASDMLDCLEASGFEILTEDREGVAGDFIDTMLGIIESRREQKRGQGVSCPEINIVEVWKEASQSFEREGVFSLETDIDFRLPAFLFEMRSNPVYPMPGMEQIIRKLEHDNLALGIVSNAQFYTPIIFNYLLNGDITSDDTVVPFSPGLTIFSYMYERAKPDPRMFEPVLPTLTASGLSPDQVLFVGNDMFNDVWCASRAGLRTALFAGDLRSLRLRDDRNETDGLEPDCVITELGQIADIVGKDA